MQFSPNFCCRRSYRHVVHARSQWHHLVVTAKNDLLCTSFSRQRRGRRPSSTWTASRALYVRTIWMRLVALLPLFHGMWLTPLAVPPLLSLSASPLTPLLPTYIPRLSCFSPLASRFYLIPTLPIPPDRNTPRSHRPATRVEQSPSAGSPSRQTDEGGGP